MRAPATAYVPLCTRHLPRLNPMSFPPAPASHVGKQPRRPQRSQNLLSVSSATRNATAEPAEIAESVFRFIRDSERNRGARRDRRIFFPFRPRLGTQPRSPRRSQNKVSLRPLRTLRSLRLLLRVDSAVVSGFGRTARYPSTFKPSAIATATAVVMSTRAPITLFLDGSM